MMRRLALDSLRKRAAAYGGNADDDIGRIVERAGEIERMIRAHSSPLSMNLSATIELSPRFPTQSEFDAYEDALKDYLLDNGMHPDFIPPFHGNVGSQVVDEPPLDQRQEDTAVQMPTDESPDKVHPIPEPVEVVAVVEDSTEQLRGIGNQELLNLVYNHKEMKLHFDDYTPATARKIIQKMQTAKSLHDSGDGSWGPRFVATLVGISPTTAGRYFRAFWMAGLREINGVEIPYKPRQTEP